MLDIDAVVNHRRSQRRYSSSLLACQRYVLDELQELFRRSEDSERKKQINLLVDIYRQTPSPPVRRRLNRVKNNGMTGAALLEELSAIYHEYKLSERQAELEEKEAALEVPQIVCSEALQEGS